MKGRDNIPSLDKLSTCGVYEIRAQWDSEAGC